MHHRQIADLRQQLWLNGYRVVPIAAGYKYPIQKQWPELARANPPYITTVLPDPRALGTGILCDGLRIIDIDIEDAALCDFVAAYFLDRFGPAPIRSRSNSFRKLLMYRATVGEPAKARALHKQTKTGVEILGRGNQFFAFGTHPSGAPLRWDDCGPDTMRRDDLGTIDETETVEAIDWCAAQIGANSVSYGNHAIAGSPCAPSPAASTGAPTTTLPTFTGGVGSWPIVDIVDALLNIPNSAADWDFWFKVGAATFAASAGSQDGYDAFMAWSRQCPAHSDKEAGRLWSSLLRTPTSNISAGTLHHYALHHNPLWVQPSRAFVGFGNFFNN